MARLARKTYRRVFGTTILPGDYSPSQVEQRRLVNTWMREPGVKETVKNPTSCAFLLTFTMTISYTLDEEESDLAMRLALRQKANGFYVLPGTSLVPGSAVEVFLCSEHVGGFLE